MSASALPKTPPLTEDWKPITYRTYRMPVPGGWLYRYDNLTMVFVPETMDERDRRINNLIERAKENLYDKDAA